MIEYECGHVSKGLLIINSSPMMLSAYGRWRESGTKLCFDCWYENDTLEPKVIDE